MSNIEETTELAVAEQSAPTRSDYDFKITDPGNMSLANIVALSKLAAKGGMSDPKGAEGLAIRSVFGVQMGFTPVEGMQGLYLIEGKPVVGAQLLAKRVKQSGKYDYRVVEMDNRHCVLEGFETTGGQRESLGKASFTMEQAAAAGLAGKAIWQKYPENMLFARAMANLHRWFMPDLIGSPFFTEGEDFVSDVETPPVVSTAQKAMEAASKRVAKNDKKAPAEEPKGEVIEATFVEEPAATSVKIAQETVAPATPTQDGSKTEQPKPTHAAMIEEETPSISNGGLPDPLDVVWSGDHVGLRPTTYKDKPAVEVFVVETGKLLPGAVGYVESEMLPVAHKAEELWGKTDAQLKTLATNGSNIEQKLAKVIMEHKPKAAPAPAAEPEAKTETVESIKAEGDESYEASANALEGEIGSESFGKLASMAVNAGLDFDAFVTSEILAAKRSEQTYLDGNETKKFSLVSLAWMAWQREAKACK